MSMLQELGAQLRATSDELPTGLVTVAMERLRSAVADADWAALDVAAPITVSIGVATSDPDGPTGPGSWRELFDRADLHLFGAKRGGRNRVRAAGGQLPPAPSGAVPSTGSVDDLVAEVLGGVRRPPGWAFSDDGEVAS